MLATRTLAASVAVACFTLAAPAHAVVQTFASFVPDIVSPANIRYEKTGIADGQLFTITTFNSNVPGAVDTRFTFINSPLALLGVLDASFSLSASVTDNPALSIGGFLVQNINSGSFSFTYSGAAPLVVDGTAYNTGANLLTGVFTNANVFGSVAGSSGSVFGSTPDGTLVYTSDLLDFNATSNKDFSLALTSILPFLTRLNPDSSIGSFAANATGAFSAEISAVPEPGSWVLLTVGFGLVGVSYRRSVRIAQVAS